MNIRLRLLALPLLLGFAGACAAVGQPDTTLQAPNVVPISARLVTSGQPSAEALTGLGARGFDAVIYLAPATVPDAVADEAQIVAAQGVEFIHIPIPFGDPTEAAFSEFVATMNRLRERKVLVHCQVNMRASSLTFLYRAVILHDDPELAYQSVTKVWSPQGPWKTLLVAELRKAGISFELY